MPHTSNGSADEQHINLQQKWELQYWVQELVASEQRIMNAINSVGIRVEDVKQYLKTN